MTTMPTSMPTEIESDISMNSFPYPPSIAENESIDLLPQGADNSANDLRQSQWVSGTVSRIEESHTRSEPADISSGDGQFVLLPKWLKEQMLKSTMTVRIALILLINSGLPNCSKTTALEKLLEKVGLSSSVLEEKDGIAFCDILAARNLCKNEIVYVPPVREKGYPTVMYAGVENMIRMIGKRLKDVVVFPSDNFSGFNNEDLDEHFKHALHDLHKANHAKHRQFTEWDESHTCGIALINIWDLGLNKIPTYVLSHLAGHLYNSYVWMFLDLLRDADHLYEVPDIPDNRYDTTRNDKELIMRWRSRIRYLLRFAKLASMKNGRRQNVSNIVTSYTGSEEIEGHMIKLKEAVDTVSKQLELQDLIDTETIAFHHLNIEPLYQLFEKIIRAGLDNTEDVPISFIFLRSMFYGKDQLYIQKDELRKISKELNIDDKNFEWFCRLFTSFGSIIDVSLIDSTSNLIILKPVQFLNEFDKLFYYSPGGTIVTSHGLVSKATSEEIFGGDAHVFMSFLKSLRIATEISPEQVNIPTEQRSYYVPNICTSPPLLQCNPTSLHLVHDMNISLSHFKVSFTAKFLNSYPEAQLNVTMTPNINYTRFCSPSVSLLFELIYLGDIIEFRFPPNLEDLGDICECIVRICHGIMDQSDILYDFAIMCSNDISQACKLQTRRHSLPLGEEDCTECSCPHDSASVEIFNDVLKKHKIDENKVLNGEFSSEDVATMSKKLATLSTKVAKKVYYEFSEESSSTSASDEEGRSLPSDEDLRNWRTFMSMILAWEVRHKKHAKRECALKLEAIAQELDDKSADADKLMELYRSFIKGSYQQKGST